MDDEEQQVGLAGGVLGGLDLVVARAGVAVADAVQEHEPAGDARRVDLVALDLVGGRQDVRHRLPLAEHGVDEARLAGLDLAEDEQRDLVGWLGL